MLKTPCDWSFLRFDHRSLTVLTISSGFQDLQFFLFYSFVGTNASDSQQSQDSQFSLWSCRKDTAQISFDTWTDYPRSEKKRKKHKIYLRRQQKS